MSKSLLDLLVTMAAKKTTKEEFGRIMHDPNSTEDEIAAALKDFDTFGYDNLPDE